MMDRWSQDEGVHHPDARGYAKELEARGYVQVEPDDLNDREGVIVMSGADGGHAPARYYRKSKPDDTGLRVRHEFETWPDTPHAERITYQDAAHEVSPGVHVNRLGVFRLTSPAHNNDIAALYDGRLRRHREESKVSA